MTTHENGAIETPEWEPTPKPWDEKRCCPTSCAGVCESPQHAALMHGTDAHIIKGDN